jgi:4-hydroxybutyrate CoA-transferase
MLRAPYVKNVELIHLLTYGTSPYCAPDMAEHFRHNALFVGGNVREAVNDGRADYTPIFLGEVEALFESGEMPIDVAFIQVSPPDSHGYCSFGVGVECTLTAAKYAHHVVAQVNAQMPRTYGDSFIHVSEIDAIVELSRPLCEMKKHPTNRSVSANRRARGFVDRRRGRLTMWDRCNSRRHSAQPDGSPGPRRAHRDDL